jgi:hypothetical protein
MKKTEKKIFLTREEKGAFVALADQVDGARQIIETITKEKRILWKAVMLKYGLDQKKIWNLNTNTREVVELGRLLNDTVNQLSA